MLISCSIENWMSFNEKASFSLIGSKERQHSERVPTIKKYPIKILPIAAIYGGNASGKTNFFKALNFAKNLIVKGTRPDSVIPTETFLLDPEQGYSPSRFIFELLIEDMIYEFSFSVTRKSVLEEKLVLIKSNRERVLYHRYDGAPHFDETGAEKKFLEFAFRGTRDNQLFLTNAISQKLDDFRPVYNWFENSLELISPDSKFQNFELFFNPNDPLCESINQKLIELDTGIVYLRGEPLSFENLQLPTLVKDRIEEELKEGVTISLETPRNDRFVITRTDGTLSVQKLVTYHSNAAGTTFKFEIHQESDGTRRAIELLPALLNLSQENSKKVYIIDEFDRSLHTLLTKKLIQSYLSRCSTESRSQLLFTTHDLLLMDQQLFRRDEMWVTERDDNGNSRLLSFSDYKDVRNDKDIRKSYLQGRLGGIPRILVEAPL